MEVLFYFVDHYKFIAKIMLDEIIVPGVIFEHLQLLEEFFIHWRSFIDISTRYELAILAHVFHDGIHEYFFCRLPG